MIFTTVTRKAKKSEKGSERVVGGADAANES
jgi:hypothetical protein